MTTTQTHDGLPGYFDVTRRVKCFDCHETIEAQDLYCAWCGKPQDGTYHRLIRLAAEEITPAWTEPMSDGNLSKAVREWLKRNRLTEFTRVRTHHGRVTVYLDEAHADPNDCPRHNSTNWRTECLLCDLAHETAKALESILRRAFPGHGGIGNDNPGADYPYLILPSLSVTVHDFRWLA